ncbi:hypothetical protein Tco_1557020 [Tanacetum coccineum]
MFWMYLRFVQVFVNKQVGDMSHHKRIYVTPSHTNKIFGNMKREGKCFSGRVTPLFQTMMVQAHEDMGEGSEIPTDPHHTPIIQPSTSQPQKKQSRRKQRKDTKIPQSSGPIEPIADEAANEENVPIQSNDPPLSRVNTLRSGEDRLKLQKLMDLCIKLFDRVLDLETTKTAQTKEIASLKKRVKKLEWKRKSKPPGMKILFKIGRSAQVVSSEDEDKQEVEVEKVVSTTEVTIESATTTVDELTLAQTLIEIKAAKPKVRGGKAKMIESEEPLKMNPKDQVLFDEQEAIRLQAQFNEKERVAREKEEANAALIEQWNDIQDKVETDYEMAQRLQAEKQEALTIEEKSKLFQQLLEKRRRHFAAKKAEERRSKPPTKSQQRSIMTTDLKNIAGWKPKDLKNKSFASV